MTLESLNKALIETQRFVRAAKEARKRLASHPDWMKPLTRTRETAAVKRASMDLSRALSEMRRR